MTGGELNKIPNEHLSRYCRGEKGGLDNP